MWALACICHCLPPPMCRWVYPALSHSAAGSTPLRRTLTSKPMCRWVYPASSHSAFDQRSSINDQRSIGGLSAAFATAPVISGAGRMQMQVLRNLRSATCDQRSSDLRRHLYMHCLCCKPQKFEDRLNRESLVSDRRSWSSVFCIFLNFVFDFCHKSQVIPSR